MCACLGALPVAPLAACVLYYTSMIPAGFAVGIDLIYAVLMGEIGLEKTGRATQRGDLPGLIFYTSCNYRGDFYTIHGVRSEGALF